MRILIIFFLLGLIYILAPGPGSIGDFSPLPNSQKSDEPGDTVQVPQISAYFSDFDRAAITNFYRNNFRKQNLLGMIIPPISLNHPPEYARMVVRDQIYVTFFEEYVYPLRSSILVAGYEPYIENEMRKRQHNFVGDHLHINGVYYNSKTTLRFFNSKPVSSILVYLGIWLAGWGLYIVSRKALREREF